MGWEERSFLEEGRRKGKADAKIKLRHQLTRLSCSDPRTRAFREM